MEFGTNFLVGPTLKWKKSSPDWKEVIKVFKDYREFYTEECDTQDQLNVILST